MAQVIWTLGAINDLDSIGKYIALDSELAAKKLIKEIISKQNFLLITHIKENKLLKQFWSTDKSYVKATKLFIELKRMLFTFHQYTTKKKIAI